MCVYICMNMCIYTYMSAHTDPAFEKTHVWGGYD